MKKLALTAALLFLGSFWPAYAVNSPPPCCACFIPDSGGQVVAQFCVSPTSPEESADAENRCGDIPNAELLCSSLNSQTGETARQDVSPSCAALLLETQNILCPGAAAPALDAKALAAVAGLLALLSAWTLRRRAPLG